ncbi:pseudouridine synthase [Treponema sp.]|uniref:pseudouridine synthase n=1 Tax=Treponema sp. TaxID=166 RepID=UPI00298E262A|nr:pseudouridine synthase [Treponema sp.]MCQ2240638.1 pseudouridine synthase [Treponema sp.]
MNSLYENINIIHKPSEKEPFLILDKPRGLPSAPLFSGDESALSYAVEKFPEIAEVKGKKEIEFGLVHRIDTETRGLLLVACTQDFYDSIILEQTNGRFIKSYEAYCDLIAGKNLTEGFPKRDESSEYILECLQNLTNEGSFSLEVRSRFRPYGLKNSQVRPVNDFAGKAAEKKAGSKEYITLMELEKSGNEVHAFCKIREGYRHQVRCHLAWLGLPIKGDPLYNPKNVSGQQFLFTAVGLEFLGFSFSL